MSKTPHYLELELNDLIKTDPDIWTFVQQGSLDGVWYWDLENPEHEYMSPEFWRNFGFDPDTKTHDPVEWQDLIHPEDLETAKANFAAHLADPDHPYDQVVRYLRADGSTSWVRCRGIAVRDKSGKPVRMLGAHNDITAQQQHALDVEATRDEFETIFETVTSGIVAFGQDGSILRCNSRARHLLGGISAPTPFEWPKDIQFLDAETLQPLEASADPLRRALARNQLKNETHLLQRVGQENSPRYVRVSTAAVEHKDSTVKMVLVLHDVSQEERNRQVVERKSRLDALGQLTGGIAHDFNNLLTSLLYSIVLAGRSDSKAGRMENLKEAEASIEIAKSLTTRLMTFARKQPGMSASRPVTTLFDDFKRLVRPMLEETITLKTDLSDSDLIVFCELAQLETALMNLVLNSRDAILRSGKGSQITLAARSVPSLPNQSDPDTEAEINQRYIELSVTDDGPGMMPETLARATDPFFTTKDTNSGTGLGLATVYGFARQSSGDLRIYSETGVGTTVQLTLPRGTTAGLREPPMPAQDIIPGQGQVILLVEDEPAILNATSLLLEDIGYTVIPAASGPEAWNIVSRGTEFDLLLTDVVMPEQMGGFELARRVRELHPNVPVLYFSGYTGFTPGEMGEIEAPLLQKPAPPAELAHAIANSLLTK